MLYLLPHAIDRAAMRTPDHEALRYSGASLTYAALAERADRLAGLLRAQGVRRGDRVAIHAGKGLAAGVALYGIMKAGAAYVPLDPSSPPARQAFIVRDCGIRHVVTEQSRGAAMRLLLAEGVPIECVIGLGGETTPGVRAFTWSDVDAHAPVAHDPDLVEMDLAYVLYTSGSTGTPKGVAHSHRSALAFARVAADTYGFRADDRLSNHAPLHFDLSTMDYFSSALAGATTVIIPEPHTRLPASYAALIESERLTVLYAVPLALTHLLLHGALDKRDLASVRWVLFGGEPFPVRHLRALMAALPGARFSNVYGPTEVNGVTYWIVPPLPPDDDTPIPIGQPYANVEARIVGDDDAPVADGEAGELLVRTPTMMRGYWGRPDLDERAFMTRRAVGHFEDVYLRTGDLVRRRDDGLLEFHGRKDRQVKARGYRVELDEVEVALGSHPAVESAAAYGVPDDDGSLHIEATVTLRAGQHVTPETLRTHVATTLPRYAIPLRVDVVGTMPRTSTGKIDRRELARLAAERAPTVNSIMEST
ncbi:MAG TPA: amino acid adenylation domain-containing protein [Gemmatimonadaceae bacterium]|nr:amino acid adenylation domain-containing protein [Gemmatimonadaceae bacterium]